MQYDVRIQLKSDTEAKWKLVENTFKPLIGEMIIYSADASHSYSRVKIGDGESLLKDLSFIDAGTINGNAVEIVKIPNFASRPSPGSPDKLYVDTSTNIIYHYDGASGYTQLSNFTLNVSTTPASKITSWDAGTMTNATIENNTLKIINGQLPSLSHSNITVVNGVSTIPTEQE